MAEAPAPLDLKIAAADAGADALAGQGAALAAPAALAPADDSAQWVAAAEHYGGVLRAMLPDHAKPHWTDERLNAVGVQLARCAKHYGWKFGETLNHPLAMLAAASFPLAWPLIEPYVKPHLERAAKEGAAPGAERAPAPGVAAVIVPVKPIDG